MSIVALCLLSATGARAQAATSCSSLNGVKVDASAVALPTKGASVTQATAVPPTAGKPGYCLVTGVIAPVDPQAGTIRFKVALPDTWNGRALMLGGSGYDGFVPDVAAGPVLFPAGTPTPVERGFAVFGSDSGHQAKSFTDPNVASLTNDETYRNFVGDAVKKTRDAAASIIRTRYGQAPSRSYFIGGSKGGGEALQAAARWPQDWDGIVAMYPGRDLTVTVLGMLTTMRALAAPGAFPSADKQVLFHRAALEACDQLDGAKDGIISDLRRCATRFAPRRATVDGAPLLCAGTGGDGAHCLTDAEIAALERISSPTSIKLSPDASGVTFPGYNALTADFRGSSTGLSARSGILGVVPPPALGSSPVGLLANGFIRYEVLGDPSANPLTFDPSIVGPQTARIQALHRIDDVDGDLTPFARRGGKLIILQGLDDLFISPRATEKYVTGLKARMGAARSKAFLRYFEAPGFGHADSATFLVTWDALSTIQDWVEKRADPSGRTVLADRYGDPGRTRPACEYPTWPKYRAGDVRQAASFTCSAE